MLEVEVEEQLHMEYTEITVMDTVGEVFLMVQDIMALLVH